MKDAHLYVAAIVWWFCLATFVALSASCAPEGVTFDDAATCGDSICLETRGMTEDEVYVGGACEEGTGTAVDLSACCPDGYAAVGYCSAAEHIVACVRECEDAS